MDLRDEIIESQKARADLFKWKIILVAAIGAAGLGLGAASSSGANKPEYLLCLIPLVCVYTDVLCSHLNLRIMVIGYFLRVSPNKPALYETFAFNARHLKSLPISAILGRIVDALRSRTLDAFVFEDYALHVTTMALSLFVFILGVLIHLGYVAGSLSGEPGMFYIAGGLGVAVTAWAFLAYKRRLAALEKAADEWQRQTPGSLPA